MREIVIKYALEMENQLKENDYKGGWQDDAVSDLLERLDQEVSELRSVITLGPQINESYEDWYKELCSEAADVGNFAAMIMDNTQRKYY